MDEKSRSFSVFLGVRLLTHGSLREILPVLKSRFNADPGEVILVFERESGRQVDFDLRGSLEDVLEREAPEPARRPGRPRLGVICREVSLLPKHWSWLEAQPSGISGVLRRLVDEAAKHEPDRQRARQAQTALSRFLTAMAGNLPHYEGASRALFANDLTKFEALVKKWPKDIRDYVVAQGREAHYTGPKGGNR